MAKRNTSILRPLNVNGFNMGTGLDSAVLEYQGLPGGLLDYWPEDMKVRPIRWKGIQSKRNFIVRWKQDGHDVRFIVTKGRATAPGKPRIDIRPWDNGNPPDPYILECVIAATLRAIDEEATKRNWTSLKQRHIPSPIIPLLESRPDIYRALFKSSGDHIVVPGASESVNGFAPPCPSIHVHIIAKKYMIDAFKGAQTRFFGDKPMVPGVNDLQSGNTNSMPPVQPS